MKDRRRLEQVLLSHDGNSYRAGKLAKPYDALFTHMIPALRKADFTAQEIQLLTVGNPARAFTISVRTQ
jgi:predicted metal-dependent phosphotriesterase family hydrolase